MTPELRDHLVPLLERGERAAARHLVGDLPPAERHVAARLALALGRPDLAAEWWRSVPAADPNWTDDAFLGLAAAFWRLNRAEESLDTLVSLAPGARVAVLRARAHSLRDPDLARGEAREALALARQEGDAAAVVQAVTLLGELLVASGEPRAALLTLAEGLKVSEIAGVEADPHLLAVLAQAQTRVGSERKARATAEKALARSAPRSPARVLALRLLGREDEARREREDGLLFALP